MGAGGSDYGGMAKGAIGQGFAQGAEAASQNYLRYKAQLDQKAQQELDNKFREQNANSQQAEFALKYVTAAFDNIMKGDEMPDPEKATPEELKTWSDNQNAKLAQLPALQEAMGTAFKRAGIEIDPATYVNSMFGGDPSKLLNGRVNRVVAGQNFQALKPKIEGLRDQAAQFGAKYGFDSKEYKTAYTAYLDAINKPDEGLGVSFADAYKTATGRAYVDPTANPAEFLKGVRSTLVNTNVKDRLAALASTDPAALQILQQVEQGGLDANSIIQTASGPMKVVDYVNGVTKSEDIKKLTTSGSPEDLDKALNIMFTMSDEQRANLSPELTAVWETYTQYQTGERDKNDGSVFARALLISELPKLNNLQLKGQISNLEASTTGQLERLKIDKNAAITGMARDAAQGINVNTAGNKAYFMSQLPQDMSTEDQEKEWEAFFREPYTRALAKDAAGFQALQNQVTAGALANVTAQSELVTSGGLYLTATHEDGSVNYESSAFQLYAKERGGVTAQTKATFAALVATSKGRFDALSETQQLSLQRGRAEVRIVQEDAEYAEWYAPMRKELGEAQRDTAVSTATMAGVNAEIAKATKEGQISSANARSIVDGVAARVATATEQNQIDASDAQTLLAEIQAEIANATKADTISVSAMNAMMRRIEANIAKRTQEAVISTTISNSVMAGVDARIKTATEGAVISSTNARSIVDQVTARVATATEAGQITQVNSQAITAEINAAIAKATKNGVINAQALSNALKAVELRVARATEGYTVTSAANAAAISGSQRTIYGNQATMTTIEATVAKAGQAGRLAQTFNETADQLGAAWLNSGEPERLFGNVMTPAQLKGARTVAAVRISLKNEGDNLTILNEYIKNPQVWARQPAKLRAVAMQAGIDPGEFVARIGYLATTANRLSDLQVQQVKTSIWASKQNVDIAWAGQTLSELNRTDRNSQWGLEYERNLANDKNDEKWKKADFDRTTAQTEISNAMEFIKLEQSGKALDIQQQGIVAQYKGVILPTIIESNRVEQANIAGFNQQIEGLIGDNSYIRQQAAKITFDKNGKIQYPAGISPQHQTVMSNIGSLMQQRRASQTSLNNTNALLSTVSNSLKGTSFSLNDLVGDRQNPENFITSGGLRIPSGANRSAVIRALDNYPGSTPSSRAVIGGIKSVLTGQSGGGSEIYEPGWCGRFVKTVLLENYNIPKDVNLNANAKGIYDALVDNGMQTNAGKPLTNTNQLRDGMVLWQASPDKDENGNVIGHIAIYAGGKIWQNSYYKDNKVNGAVGWMDPAEFLKAYKTYGAEVPSRLAKEGYQGGGSGTPAPAGAPSSSGGKVKATPAPSTAKVEPKWTDGQGNFNSGMDFNALTRGRGKTVTKIAPNGPLQVWVGNGYRQMDDPKAATSIMNAVSYRALQYFDTNAASRGSMDLRKIAKSNPQAAVDAMVNIITSAPPGGTVPFGGNVRQYAETFLRSKGIIK